MTQEQKAKAYDKALEKAKSIIDDLRKGEDILAVSDLESMFPELAESEDERIRKALLEMVHDTTGDELWIDYNVHKEEALAWLEKQGEQRSKLVDFGYNAKDSDLQEVTYFIPNGFHAEIDGNKVVIKRGEQKPAKWSEEDELIALSIEHVMNCASLLNIVPDKIDKIRAWLKSLKDRYTWKPSDEQMAALSSINVTGGVSYVGQGQELINLYNDLKKLMEE